MTRRDAKLTDEQVREFRTRRVINGEYLVDLCAEFGITTASGSRIARGVDRAAAGGPLAEKQRNPTRHNPNQRHGGRRILTMEDEALIVEMIKNKARHQAIADVFFVSRSCITHVWERYRERESNA